MAVTQDKFDHQEPLHEAFGDDPTTVGLAAAKAKLDKCEERLIAAKSRQDAAYNRHVVTLLESRNKKVGGVVRQGGYPTFVIKWGQI